MRLFNQIFNNKLNYFDTLSLLLFSILPISIIFGNASININILLIDFLFIFYCLKFKLWSWLKKDIFLYLMILYIFLNLNSLYSYFTLLDDKKDLFWADPGFLRSFFFIKFVLLVFAFSTLLKDDKILRLVHKNWFAVIVIVIFDVFFEKIMGKNILGNISQDLTRIASFFKDELVVGGFIFCFGYASSTYFINDNNKNKFILLIILIFLLVPLSVFISGEKSNFIKSILLFLTITYFLKKNKKYFNYKILLITIFFLISFLLIFDKGIRVKYEEPFKRFFDKRIINTATNELRATPLPTKIIENFGQIRYFGHYDVALKIFRNYPITGVGNKNFRVECTKKEYIYNNEKNRHFGCITHPHQIHFEILAEQGILGYLLILILIGWFSIKNIKMSIKYKSIYHFSNTIYVVIFFIPMLPGAGIFSTFNGILFWIIFSLVNLDYEKK